MNLKLNRLIKLLYNDFLDGFTLTIRELSIFFLINTMVKIKMSKIHSVIAIPRIDLL